MGSDRKARTHAQSLVGDVWGMLAAFLIAIIATVVFMIGTASAQTADTSGVEGRAEATQGIQLDAPGPNADPAFPNPEQLRRPLDNVDLSGPLPGTPVSSTPNEENAAFWRQLREGSQGTVSIPNAQSGILIQSGGESWQEFRNGALRTLSGVAIIGMLILLSLFFALRGRIRIEEGPSRYEVKRFNIVDRTTHWLMAISFIILAISGLNLLYGRPLLIPVIGKEAFAAVASFTKYAHNYVAFAFMLSLALSLVLWVKNNIPNSTDVEWFKQLGGLRGHAPAKKFNAGQKVLFWLVMLMGLSVSLSGWALLFPFETTLFADTFALLGFGPVSAIQEQQYAQAWHTIVSVLFVVMIFAHIYIGTVGMEGAFRAMGRGKVDYNWAKEHHGLWVEELEEQGRYPTLKPEDDRPARAMPPGGYVAPAE